MFFRKPPICHHSSQIPHRCHFGDCPPCGLICGKQLDGCKHSCPVRCHSAVKTIIRDKVSTRHSKPVLLIDWLFLVLISSSFNCREQAVWAHVTVSRFYWLIDYSVFWFTSSSFDCRWAGYWLIDYSLFWFPCLLIVVSRLCEHTSQ